MKTSAKPFVYSVLIVDDDVNLLAIYRKILELEEGFKVDSAPTHTEAMEWLKAHGCPAMILLDCRMGGMSNREFKDQVDAIFSAGPRPRLVGFSSFSQQSTFAIEMRSIFGEFIEKPIDLDDFISLMKKFRSEAA